MNVASLISEVYRRCGRAQDASSGTLDTDILNALNTVQRNINNEIDFIETMGHDKTSLRLTAETTNYDLPTDFLRMLQVWEDVDYTRELQRITPREYKNFLSDVDTSTGNLAYYDIVGSSSNVKQIYLFPLQSSVTNGFVESFAQLTGTTTSAFADYSTTVTGTVLVTDTTHGLVTGMTITIAGGTNYNGEHKVYVVDDDTFYIYANYTAEAAGATWIASGTTVADTDHGLATGDTVTFSGTTNYDASYTVIKIDDDSFNINATYVAEAGGNDKKWSLDMFVPFVYIKKLSDLTAGGSANILTTYYPDVYIEGATYIMYRDVIYRDQPEKIAFRKQEYLQQVEIAKMAQRNTDRIRKIAPKRILPSLRTLYTVEGQLR